MIAPNTVIVLVPEAGIRWIGGSKKTTIKKPRTPHRATQPIPTFDRRALHDRVSRLLEYNKLQRESLRAAALAA